MKKLLDTFREGGVARVELGEDLQPRVIEFGPMLQAIPTGDVEGTDQEWTNGAPLDLQKAVERIQKAYAKPAKAS